MNRRLLEQIFKDRRVAYDPSEGGKLMQIFRTSILPKYKEIEKDAYRRAEEDHAMALMIALFLSLPMEDYEQCIRRMAGLVSLTADMGKLPTKYHIEHLTDRWFKKVPPHAAEESYGQIVTECRLVVDEWKEPKNPTPTV